MVLFTLELESTNFKAAIDNNNNNNNSNVPNRYLLQLDKNEGSCQTLVGVLEAFKEKYGSLLPSLSFLTGLYYTFQLPKVSNNSDSASVPWLSSSSCSSTAANGQGCDWFRLSPVGMLKGGKGGFGSQLRAQGGKMSRRNNIYKNNRQSCRDLEGRRLRDVQQAELISTYLKDEPERVKERSAKYEAKMERVLQRWEQVQDGSGPSSLGAAASTAAPLVQSGDQDILAEKEKLFESLDESISKAMSSLKKGKEKAHARDEDTSASKKKKTRFWGMEDLSSSSEEEENEEEISSKKEQKRPLRSKK